MQDPYKSRKNKTNFEINWKIKEIFSEAALNSYFKEIEYKYPLIEKENN